MIYTVSKSLKNGSRGTFLDEGKSMLVFDFLDVRKVLIKRQTWFKVDRNRKVTTLRESFWILKGSPAVKHVLKRCMTCHKLEGLQYSSHNSPDLPSFRVSIHRSLALDWTLLDPDTSAQKEIKTKKAANATSVYPLAPRRELFN